MIYSNYQTNQSGIALVISLIFLLLLTIIGITSMRVNLLEERMAGNARDQNVAFQAAESTLREAEGFIMDNPTTALIYDGANGLLNSTDDEPTNFFTHDWAADSAATTIDYRLKFGVLSDPRYIIKKVSQVAATGVEPQKTYFRITAQSDGATAGTQVILQEYYVRSN